jgi:hypothetical protein
MKKLFFTLIFLFLLSPALHADENYMFYGNLSFDVTGNTYNVYMQIPNGILTSANELFIFHNVTNPSVFGNTYTTYAPLAEVYISSSQNPATYIPGSTFGRGIIPLIPVTVSCPGEAYIYKNSRNSTTLYIGLTMSATALVSVDLYHKK